jgi:hypothetical protein
MKSWSRLTVAAVALASAIVLAGRPVSATVLLEVSFEAQSRTAGRIFVGAVQAVVSQPSARAPRYFETRVTFAVADVIAGEVPATVALRFSGGQVGDLKQWIDGMPEFTVGERYVVFLEPEQDPPLISPIVGFNQGLYRVVVDASGADVVRDRQGGALSPDRAVPAARAGAGGDPDLAAFITAIEAAR